MKELYEDEESLKMMKIINDQANCEFRKNQEEYSQNEKRKNVRTGIYLIGSIILFAFIMAWIIILNLKLNKQEMNNCLVNNDNAYCKQYTGWGAE